MEGHTRTQGQQKYEGRIYNYISEKKKKNEQNQK